MPLQHPKDMIDRSAWATHPKLRDKPSTPQPHRRGGWNLTRRPLDASERAPAGAAQGRFAERFAGRSMTPVPSGLTQPACFSESVSRQQPVPVLDLCELLAPRDAKAPVLERRRGSVAGGADEPVVRALPNLRDFYSIFNISADPTGIQLDNELNRMERYWDPQLVDRELPDLPAVARESVRRSFRELQVVFRHAHQVLICERSKKQYDQKQALRTDNPKDMLDSWALKLGPECISPDACWALLVPPPPCKSRCELPVPDCVIFSGADPSRWLFTNKEGFVVAKKAEWSSGLRRDVLNSMGKWKRNAGSKWAAKLVYSGDGLPTQLVTMGPLEESLKGHPPLGAVSAIQAVIRPQPGTSVFKNLYQLNEDLSSARRTTSVVSNMLPGLGQSLKSDAFAAAFVEEPSKIAAINQQLDHMTWSLAKHFQNVLRSQHASDAAYTVKVLRLEAEYTVAQNGQIWFSKVLNLFTCGGAGAPFLAPAPPFPHRPIKLQPQTLGNFQPSWMVQKIRNPVVMSPPHSRVEIPAQKRVEKKRGVRTYELFRGKRPIDRPLMEKAEAAPYKDSRSGGGAHPEFQNKKGLFSRRTFGVPTIAQNFGSPNPMKRANTEWTPNEIGVTSPTVLERLGGPLMYQPRYQSEGCLAIRASVTGSLKLDISKKDSTAREGFATLWEPKKEPPKVNGDIIRQRKANAKECNPEEVMANEVIEIAKECTFPVEQVQLLYRSFQRATNNNFYFNELQFGGLLRRWGINKDTVLQRMFAAYADPDMSQSEQRMPYSNAIRVLCSLGCGNRVKQAEALFTVCDEDGGGLVTRAELLKFIAGSLPSDTVQHKTETFSRVGKLFLMIDEDGSGECSREEFINGVAGNPKIYDAFREMNPYTQFFKTGSWKKNDESLQNLLTAAYYSADPREHHAAIRDRVLLLANKVDEDHSGRLEMVELLCLMEGMGMEEEEAERESQRLCGTKGMKIREFVDMFVDLASTNLKRFQFVEKSFGVNGPRLNSAASSRAVSRAPTREGTMKCSPIPSRPSTRGRDGQSSPIPSRPSTRGRDGQSSPIPSRPSTRGRDGQSSPIPSRPSTSQSSIRRRGSIGEEIKSMQGLAGAGVLAFSSCIK